MSWPPESPAPPRRQIVPYEPKLNYDSLADAYLQQLLRFARRQKVIQQLKRDVGADAKRNT